MIPEFRRRSCMAHVKALGKLFDLMCRGPMGLFGPPGPPRAKVANTNSLISPCGLCPVGGTTAGSTLGPTSGPNAITDFLEAKIDNY